MPRWDKATSVHNDNGDKLTPQQRRKFIMDVLKVRLHIHEIWVGNTYRWYIIRTGKTKLCGTDACILIYAKAR